MQPSHKFIAIAGCIAAVIVITALGTWQQFNHATSASAQVAKTVANTFPAGIAVTPQQANQAEVGSQTDTGLDNNSPKTQNYDSTKNGSVKGVFTASSSTTSSPHMIGVFESASPNEPSSLTRLEEIKSAGFNTVLNYAILGGTKAEILTYLDKAQSLGLKIIFSVKDFYDIEASPDVKVSDFKEYGSTNDSVVRGIVTTFKSHPAIYGWYISDERPEQPGDTAKWAPILKNRYQLIKQADSTHPTLVVLSCYQGENVSSWPTALKQLSGATDDLGFDSYPVPYASTSIVGQCSQVLTNTLPSPANRWFVIQGFSWSAYPEVVTSDGQDISKARYPTLAEMKAMITSAKQAGVNNILVYSYFDMKNDASSFATNWQIIQQAIQLAK